MDTHSVWNSKQLREMRNVCLVLMREKRQSAVILFLEHRIHFFLNFIVDIVMDVTPVVCISPGHSEGTLASPSCPAIFYSKGDVMEEHIHMELEQEIQGTR